MALSGQIIRAAVANVPVARLVRAAAQSIPGAGADTAISFDTAAIDTHTGWALSPNPTRYTFPITGKYLMAWEVGFDANATGIRVGYLRVNGSTVITGRPKLSAISGEIMVVEGVLGAYAATAGHYVELMVQQNSGGSLNTNTTQTPKLSVFYLRD